MPVEEIALRLVSALLLGAAIGVERQYRQRSAGLRTNGLVALGAAAFALIGFLSTEDASPSRMAAQVVSGIGFLGAGAILRQGLDVKGMNTAATLWCSAAVGIGCGAGQFALAGIATGLIVAVNIVIRPIVGAIDRAPRSGAEYERAFRIAVTGAVERRAALRQLMIKQIAESDARLQRLDSEDLAGPEGAAPRVALTAQVIAGGSAEERLEAIVARLSLEAGVTRAGWSEVED